jgi:hypothetical protein
VIPFLPPLWWVISSPLASVLSIVEIFRMTLSSGKAARTSPSPRVGSQCYMKTFHYSHWIFHQFCHLIARILRLCTLQSYRI